MRKILKIMVFVLLIGSVFLAGWRFFYRQSESDVSSAIPLVLHYCWLGGQPEPAFVKKAIESWKKFAPDFKIKRWDETNCNVKANPFVAEAYELKRFDFVSDYCRIVALESEGGLYLDTDSFLRAPLLPLLTEPLILTRESAGYLSGSFIGAVPHHPLMQVMRLWYEEQSRFLPKNDMPALVTSFFKNLYPELSNQNVLQQKPDSFIIYPSPVLMLNFGGPENVAEHWYANGKSFSEKGPYYYYFYNLFLERDSYRLEENKEGKITMRNLIFLPENRFYTVQTKETGRYTFYADSFLMIHWDTGLEEGYICRDYVCVPALNQVEKKEQKRERPFQEQPTFIRVSDESAEIMLGKQVYLRQGGWEGWNFIIGSRLINLLHMDWAVITSQDENSLSLKWDAFGEETFEKQKDGSYLIVN